MTLPIRLRIENFHRFERLIGQAVAAYPEPTIFEVPELSPETVTSRMRDAINCFLKPENIWGSTFFTKDELRVIWGECTISHDGKKVRFGPKIKGHLEKITSTHIGIDKSEDSNEEHIVQSPSDMDVKCLIYLLSRGVLTGMFRLRFASPDARESAMLQQRFPDNIEQIIDGADLIIL